MGPGLSPPSGTTGSSVPASPPSTIPSAATGTLVPPGAVGPSLPPEAAAIPTVTAPPLQTMRVERVFPRLSFPELLLLAHPDDGTNRLFSVTKPGKVWVFPNDQSVASATLFLDIARRVHDAGDEEGLLGLAFDPGYATSGSFYVYYSAFPPRRSVLSRFLVDQQDPNRADPSSEEILLEILQPYPNHNGGGLAFGPDGYLYVGLGDGGSQGDPHGYGQDKTTLLGKILRIDVRGAFLGRAYQIPPDNPFVDEGGAVRGEIWAYGLRNPWRLAFDRATGLLWAGDVGQDAYEEINLIKPGRNYGWRIMEGAHCFPPGIDGCDLSGLELPVMEYSHEEGCSVIGGLVYRSTRLPSLYGAYLYGDFCSGKVWALWYDGSRVVQHLELVDSTLHISSFGDDQAGEIYILSLEGGIYRLIP
ncbi:MAG: PQQ-dependent sugar dehydrogenase [Chloroflexi bacterium]|nr:PQQ-dependent sugar dehydrogenase [Chloroflexota bacterium]